MTTGYFRLQTNNQKPFSEDLILVYTKKIYLIYFNFSLSLYIYIFMYIYIYDIYTQGQCFILYIMRSISNHEVFEKLFGAHGGGEGICQE